MKLKIGKKMEQIIQVMWKKQIPIISLPSVADQKEESLEDF
jgi:hypothetical protein